MDLIKDPPAPLLPPLPPEPPPKKLPPDPLSSDFFTKPPPLSFLFSIKDFAFSFAYNVRVWTCDLWACTLGGGVYVCGCALD